jgi:hypothetical protein
MFLMFFRGWHDSGYGGGRWYRRNPYYSRAIYYADLDACGFGCGPFTYSSTYGVGYCCADGWQHTFADRHLFIGLITEPAPQYGFGEKTNVVLLGV